MAIGVIALAVVLVLSALALILQAISREQDRTLRRVEAELRFAKAVEAEFGTLDWRQLMEHPEALEQLPLMRVVAKTRAAELRGELPVFDEEEIAASDKFAARLGLALVISDDGRSCRYVPDVEVDADPPPVDIERAKS